MHSTKKLTTEEFIKRAKEVHGNEYDYSKVEYVNAMTKVCIISKKYGEFWQTPMNHLKGFGVNDKFHVTTNDFIQKAKKVHRG